MSSSLKRGKVHLPKFERHIWLFFLSVLIGGLAQSINQLYLNLYILSLGFDKDFMGLIGAIPSFTLLIFGLPTGLLIDRLGARPSLIIGYFSLMVLLGAFLFAGSPPVLLTLRFLFGLMSGLVLLATAPFIMQIATEQTRTTLFSANFGLATLVGFAGNLLAGQLPKWIGASVNSPEAYRGTLLLSAVLIGVSALPLIWIRPAAASGSAAPPFSVKRLWSQLQRPLIRKLLLPNFFVGFGAAILIPYMNVYFREKHSTPDDVLGILFSLASIATGLATLIGPRLARRLGKVRAAVTAQGTSLVFMALIGFAPTFIIPAMSFVARSALMNMAGPIMQAFTMEQVSEDERATVNSLSTLLWNVGWAFGPALSGFVQQRYGFTPLFLATIFFYTIATSMTWFFFKNAERESGDAEASFVSRPSQIARVK